MAGLWVKRAADKWHTGFTQSDYCWLGQSCLRAIKNLMPSPGGIGDNSCILKRPKPDATWHYGLAVYTKHFQT